MAETAAAAVNTRQTIVAALVLGVVCAALVWFLERFNRDLLIAQFRAELDRLPTALRPEEGTDG